MESENLILMLRTEPHKRRDLSRYYGQYLVSEGIESLILTGSAQVGNCLHNCSAEHLSEELSISSTDDISIYHYLLQLKIANCFDDFEWSEILEISDFLLSDFVAASSTRAFAICSHLVALLETCELKAALEFFQEHQSFMDGASDWRACEARLLHGLGIARRAYDAAASVLHEQDDNVAPALLQEAERTALLMAKFPRSVEDLQSLIGRWRAKFGESEIGLRLDFLEWASRSLRDFHKKKQFTRILQSEIYRVVDQLTSEPFNLSYERSSGNFNETLWRAKRAHEAACGAFLTSIDATEIGNEARFANHSDIPNAAIVRDRTAASTGPPLMLVCLRDIAQGDEITIHYGSNYWKHPMDIFVPVDKKAEKRRAGEAVPPSEWRGCLFYDGVLPHEEDRDVSFMYERIVGDPISDRDYSEMLKNRGVQVEICPEGHPCHPGYRLMARRHFTPGARIIIYAGVLRIVSEQIEHLFNNPYTACVDNNIVGNYGFRIAAINQSPIYHKIQPNYPVFARAENCNVSGLVALEHFRASEINISGVEQIGHLRKVGSVKWLRLLADPAVLETMEDIFASGLDNKELQRQIIELHNSQYRPKRKRLH